MRRWRSPPDAALPSAEPPCAPDDRRLPLTLVLGLLVILASEALLVADLRTRGWIVVPLGVLPPPEGPWQGLARRVAVDMTPICWTAALLVLDGLLTLTGGG